MFQIDVPTVLRTSKQASAQLAKLAPAIIPAVEMAAANYLLNVITNKAVPPQKKITRVSVYGVPFKTTKQRLWFFWAKAHGIIDVPYMRRGKHGGLSTQWHIRKGKNGVMLENDDPAAKWVYGDDTQNKLIGAIGWRVISVIVSERSRNLGRVTVRAANRAIKETMPHP